MAKGVTTTVEVLVIVPCGSVCVRVCVVDGVGMARQEQALETAWDGQFSGKPVGLAITD